MKTSGGGAPTKSQTKLGQLELGRYVYTMVSAIFFARQHLKSRREFCGRVQKCKREIKTRHQLLGGLGIGQ